MKLVYQIPFSNPIMSPYIFKAEIFFFFFFEIKLKRMENNIFIAIQWLDKTPVKMLRMYWFSK